MLGEAVPPQLCSHCSRQLTLHIGEDVSVEGPGQGGGRITNISSHRDMLETESCVCIYFSLKKGKGHLSS